MCECLGYFEDQANICRGCEAWRKKHRYSLGQPCGGDIGRLATSMGRDLCYYCNEALMKFEKARAGTQTPPRGQGAHSSPPQSPPPGTPGQAAHSSPPQSPPPGQAAPPGAATPQLEQICERLDALEEVCGRMEGMMVAMMNALGVDAGQVVQAQVAQALAHPPGLAQPAVALAQPVALMQPQPQTAVPGQAQALGQVVAVNTAGDNGGRSGTHAKDQRKQKKRQTLMHNTQNTMDACVIF